MSTLSVKIWLSILLLAVGAYATYSGVRLWNRIKEAEQTSAKNQLYLKPIRPLSDFEFTERSGKKMKLSDLEGEIFAVNFFWGNCPGPCKILNDAVLKLSEEFAEDDVQFVSVTVDPVKDDPNVLRNYAERNHYDRPNWLFLTTPSHGAQDLIDLGAALSVSTFATDAHLERTHTEDIIVIDRAGMIRGAFNHKDPAELAALKKKLRDLLKEQPPGWKPNPPDSQSSTTSATVTASTTAPVAAPSPTATAPQPTGAR